MFIKHIIQRHERYKKIQIKLLNMKTTMAEMKIYWMGLTADQTLWKKRLVNLKTQQEKVSKMKYGKKTRKK